MKKKNKRIEAFFTVEASFIIPIAFLLIMVMLQYGFFCYEKTVSLQCCYLAALRGSNEWELVGQRLESYVSQEFQKLIDDRSLYRLEGDGNVRLMVSGIEVTFSEYMKAPFSNIRGDDVDGWYISNSKKALRNKPSTYIRKCQLLKDSGGGYEGSNY